MLAREVDRSACCGYNFSVSKHWEIGISSPQTQSAQALTRQRLFCARDFYGGCHGGSSERRSSECGTGNPVASAASQRMTALQAAPSLHTRSL